MQPLLECGEIEDEASDNDRDAIDVERAHHFALQVGTQARYERAQRIVLLLCATEVMHHDHGTGRSMRVMRFDGAGSDALEQTVFCAELFCSHDDTIYTDRVPDANVTCVRAPGFEVEEG